MRGQPGVVGVAWFPFSGQPGVINDAGLGGGPFRAGPMMRTWEAVGVRRCHGDQVMPQMTTRAATAAELII